MPARIHAFSRRILTRLVAAEAQEIDPWFRDDLRIARLTVAYAARGDAVLCSPDVLASYMVLGLHPEKVWPAILARRKTLLGPVEVLGVPKKPPQAVKLWSEKTIGARAVNSRASEMVLRGPRSLPMATASIAALYPNSGAPSSAKKSSYTYQEMLAIVKFSGAPHSVRHATLNALSARGRWPNEDGPANGIICVSLDGMMLGNEDGAGNCVRSTARWRARQAVKHRYWRQLRKANSWSNCRKCGADRQTGKCEKCGYVGRSKTPGGKANFDEFCRPYMYEIDIEKFRTAERAKGIRHFDARTYAEHKEAAKRGEHPNVTEMPARKPAPPEPSPLPPAPAAPLPVREKPAAEYAHRNPVRANSVVGGTAISDHATKAAQLLMEMCGLADIGALPQIAISITAEAKYRGVEIEEAAKSIAERAVRDQKKGIALTRFYFRDMKWRSNDGGQQASAAQQRFEQNRRAIGEGILSNYRDADGADGGEFKGDS